MTANSNIMKITDCFILDKHTIKKNDLWISDGKILNRESEFYENKKSPTKIISLGGGIIAPGFIDLQINGGFGIDFTHDLIKKKDGIGIVSKELLSHGVTSFCPTIITTKPENYHGVLPLCAYREGGKHGAEVLGAHVEGPFISPEKKGAHPLADILELDNGHSTLASVYKHLEHIKIVTLAPEKKNALSTIEWLRKSKDITVSMGHSMANIEISKEAHKRGANLITHLFNAMPPFHHRDPGLVGMLGVETDTPIYYGIIADGVHTHDAALRIAYRAHPNGVVLVTDAISAMGLAEGVHHLGENLIEIKNGSAYLIGTNTLCGSIATMNQSVKHFKEAVSCSLVEALEAATLHPAEVLGITGKKGTLNPGSDADFVVLNEDLDVLSTWIKGEMVYRNPKINK